MSFGVLEEHTHTTVWHSLGHLQPDVSCLQVPFRDRWIVKAPLCGRRTRMNHKQKILSHTQHGKLRGKKEKKKPPGLSCQSCSFNQDWLMVPEVMLFCSISDTNWESRKWRLSRQEMSSIGEEEDIENASNSSQLLCRKYRFNWPRKSVIGNSSPRENEWLIRAREKQAKTLQ